MSALLPRQIALLLFFALPFNANETTYRFKQDSNGLFSRTLFTGPGPADTTVTIRDIMVGPKRTETVPASTGPAILEWFEGHGTYSIAGGRKQKIGNDFDIIPAGQALVVHNPHAQAIGFRIYLFAGK